MHSIVLVAAGGFAVLLAGCGGDDETTGAPSPSPPGAPSPSPPGAPSPSPPGAPSPSPPWSPSDWSCDKEDVLAGTPQNFEAEVPTAAAYDAALLKLDMEAAKRRMETLLTDSKTCWPADTSTDQTEWTNTWYGGLMIRLAWHCSGSYRTQDKVGGCTGGRQRFLPEGNWPDNTNLDKARALLAPMKREFGDALSWGDLFILAGTTAYRQAGMNVSRMCFGRQDEPNGNRAKMLGLTAEQADPQCQDAAGNPAENGQCMNLGTTTVGLIYVNPEGPMGDPDPAESAKEVRRIFERMGHAGDEATVALVGGGHIVGGCHGACKPTNDATRSSAGNPPKDAFEKSTDIWKGECGSGTDQGRGKDTFTSGFHGYWTSKPFTWDNEFFVDLARETWELHPDPPGGHKQWRMVNASAEKKDLMRLTTDMALWVDEQYKPIVEKFANDQAALDTAFDKAWDILTTNGLGVWSPNAKCDDNGASTPPTTVSTMRSDDAEYV